MEALDLLKNGAVALPQAPHVRQVLVEAEESEKAKLLPLEDGEIARESVDSLNRVAQEHARERLLDREELGNLRRREK